MTCIIVKSHIVLYILFITSCEDKYVIDIIEKHLGNCGSYIAPSYWGLSS